MTDQNTARFHVAFDPALLDMTIANRTPFIDLSTLFADQADVTVEKVFGRGRHMIVTAPEDSLPRLQQHAAEKACIVACSAEDRFTSFP